MPSTHSPKRALFKLFAEIARAIGHEHRLELLEALAQGEMSVEVLAERTGLKIANASHHLQQMRRAGLIAARREGKFVYYRICDDAVIDLVASLARVGERTMAEVKLLVSGYFNDRDSLEPISRTELLARIEDDLVTVIDVRPEDEFALGHLPGARNIPLDKLRRRLARLDRGKQIVAYCRGPYCMLSFEAVALLRAKGFEVRRLEDGFPEWRAAGLPVEVAG